MVEYYTATYEMYNFRKPFGEGAPALGVPVLLGEFAYGLGQARAKLVVGHGRACDADDARLGRQPVLAGQPVERRDQLAKRQVTRRAKNDDA